MPTAISTVLLRPDTPDTPMSEATDAAHGINWAWATGNNWALLAGLALTVAVLVWMARRVRKIARSERPDDTLATTGMLIGLGWSGEAMWVIGTQLLHVPWPVMVVLLLVLEVNLAAAMIRAVRHHKLHGHPGRYGQTAWTIALSMALIAAFASHSLAEVALRIAIPLLVTKTWWDGLTANDTARRLAGAITWRWTPRRLLLWLGAIEPGEKDVETVNRERLTRQMTDLYYLKLYGPEKKRAARQAKLAKLTLTADDEIISEVLRRVTRTSWTTAQPLPYTVTQTVSDASDERPAGASDASGDAPAAKPATPRATRRNDHVEVPPTRRVKTSSRVLTSGDASDEDPATKAAWLVLTKGLSNQKAADAVGGTSEPSVRRRVKALREAGVTVPSDGRSDVSPVIPMTPIPEPKESVTTGANGSTFKPQEN